MEKMEIQERVERLLEEQKYKVKLIGQKNSFIKHVMALVNNTKPNPEKLFVIEGIWAFYMLQKGRIEVRNFILCPECVYSPEIYKLVETFVQKTPEVDVVSKKVFLSLSDKENNPDGLMAICKFPQNSLETVNTQNSVVVVLDGLEIPGNIGTILRSCDAAKIDAVLICNRKARLTHPKLIRGSMGAAFFVPIVEFESVEQCQKWLKENQFAVYLADTRAEKGYYEYSYDGNVALVMGSERYGITRQWYTEDVNKLSIPMLGQCDSLNVAIATTIILYEIRLKKDGLIS